MTHRIKNIVFDLGMVLVDFPWREYLHGFGFRPEAEERIAEALFLGGNWGEADKSVLSDEEIFQKTLALIPDLKAELSAVWDGRTTIVTEYDYAGEWVRALKEKGYGVYVLSNYAETTFHALLADNSFLHMADGMVISYEIRHIKPEPEMYEELIRRYALVPEECLYFDDLPANVEGGRRAGFESVVFTGYEDALGQMREYGVDIGLGSGR